MLYRNRALASLGMAIAIFGWIATSCGQQTPETKSASPPPPISFGDGSTFQIGVRSSASDKQNSNQQQNVSVPGAGKILLPSASVYQGSDSSLIDQNQNSSSVVQQSSSDAADQSRSGSRGVKQSTRASQYLFGNSNRQALAPLQPATHYQSPISDAPNLDPAKSIVDKDLDWSVETPKSVLADPNGSATYIDSQIRPAAHLEFEPSAPTSAAGLVLQTFDLDQWNAALPGQPRSITDLLAATTIESRPALIRSYWGVFEKWARRVTAQIEADQLAELRTPDTAIERDMLATANALAKARVIESEMEMETAQQFLAQFVPTPSKEMLPLAHDLPLVDEYVTRYAERGQQFGFNARLAQINQSLPKSLQIIQARADAATKCRQVVRQAIQAFNQNQLPLGSAIEAVRMLRESQQDFIRAVHRYNQDIAEYALMVAPFGQPAEQVVAMLIKQPISPASETPTIASATIQTNPQQLSQPTYAPFGDKNQPNTLRAVNSDATETGNEVSRVSPLTSPKSQAEFGTSTALQQQAQATQAENLGTPDATSKVSLPQPPPSQYQRSPSTSKPSSQQSGGGSFSFGSR